MSTINPFTDVKDVSLSSQGDLGQEVMPNVGSMKVGAGNKSFKADESGIWLGANKFVDAPFSVDMNGRATFSNVVIKDGNGTTVIDGYGLVSTNSFTKSGSVNNTLNQVLNSSADITGSSLTFTLARSATVLFQYTFSVRVQNSPGNYCDFQGSLNLDSSTVDSLDYQTISNSDNRLQSSSGTYVDTLSSGDHTVKLRGIVSNPTGTPYVLVYRYKLDYIILGS